MSDILKTGNIMKKTRDGVIKLATFEVREKTYIITANDGFHFTGGLTNGAPVMVADVRANLKKEKETLER